MCKVVWDRVVRVFDFVGKVSLGFRILYLDCMFVIEGSLVLVIIVL